MTNRVEDLERMIRQQAVRLEKLKAELEKQRAEVAKLEGELRGLTAARNIIVHGVAPTPNALAQTQREISKDWRDILSYFLRASPNVVSIDEIMQFIASREIQINRNAVRSQLHHYVNRGFLERVGDGLYRATDTIKPLCE